MSFDKNNFKYSIVDNIDYTIEEQGNQFTALRKIKWGDSDKEYLWSIHERFSKMLLEDGE